MTLGREILFWSLPPKGCPTRAAEIDAMCSFQDLAWEDLYVIPAPEDDVDHLDEYFLTGGQ